MLIAFLPLNALANPISGVSNTTVGANVFDMNGMEVTVNLASGGSETVTWINNEAAGTGWTLQYVGTDTSTVFIPGGTVLDWQLTFDPGYNDAIENMTIDAYANERVFFDIVLQPEITPGSDSGLWGPTLAGYATSGTVGPGTPYAPTGELYGAPFYWEFRDALLLQGQAAPFPQHDLFEILYFDFVRGGLTSGLQDNFQFAVDTDLVEGTEIPEPTTMVLFGLGLLGLSAVGRRKNQ